MPINHIHIHHIHFSDIATTLTCNLIAIEENNAKHEMPKTIWDCWTKTGETLQNWDTWQYWVGWHTDLYSTCLCIHLHVWYRRKKKWEDFCYLGSFVRNFTIHCCSVFQLRANGKKREMLAEHLTEANTRCVHHIHNRTYKLLKLIQTVIPPSLYLI